MVERYDNVVYDIPYIFGTQAENEYNARKIVLLMAVSKRTIESRNFEVKYTISRMFASQLWRRFYQILKMETQWLSKSDFLHTLIQPFSL